MTSLANLTAEQIRPGHVSAMNADLADAEPHEIIKYAGNLFGDRLTMACSFQDVAMVDLAASIVPDVRIFTIDTDYLFHETLETLNRVRHRYPHLRIDVFRPTLDIEQQALQHGRRLYATDPDACCAIRKLEPMRRALDGYRAWMTGIRRDQSAGRARIQPVAWDYKWDMVKFAPMCTWTAEDVGMYADMHDVPYNRLMDRGYPSIGCAPCTSVPVESDGRSGRWAGNTKTECGLHGSDDTQGEDGDAGDERRPA